MQTEWMFALAILLTAALGYTLGFLNGRTSALDDIERIRNFCLDGEGDAD